MSRSQKKGPFVNAKLMSKATKAKTAGDKKPIKTWARSSMISPEFVGLQFAVHNGRKFNPVMVTEQMVGHRLGEFSPTRYFRGHGEAHTKEAAAKT